MGLIAATDGNVHKNLGANHHMWTSANLWDNNLLTATTRTASFTWFGGFTGGVVVVALDANGVIVASTPKKTYGVNGTAFGNSDRTEGWNHQFDGNLQLAGRVVRLQPVQLWAPTWRMADDLLRIGATLAPVLL